MMKKEKSPGFNKVKLLLALPVIAGLIFAFAKKEYVPVQEIQPWLETQSIEKEKTSLLKGTVLDEAGNPLLGANVILKSTTHGTVVDRQGEFQLEAADRSILVVSFIGYKTVVTSANADEPVSINMEKRSFNIELPDVSQLAIVDVPALPPARHKDDKEVMTIVEEMPYYRKRMTSLALDIRKEVEQIMDQTNDRGETLVGFTIETSGKVSNTHVLKTSNSQILDAAALKIITKLDDWEPGVQRARPVRVDLTVPILFN